MLQRKTYKIAIVATIIGNNYTSFICRINVHRINYSYRNYNFYSFSMYVM